MLKVENLKVRYDPQKMDINIIFPLFLKINQQLFKTYSSYNDYKSQIWSNILKEKQLCCYHDRIVYFEIHGFTLFQVDIRFHNVDANYAIAFD